MTIATTVIISKAQKNSELIKKLQQKARMFFYDSMIYEINDALTSILAIYDKGGGNREAIPKIKQYISRINESLNSNKIYQNNLANGKFDINFVIKNLISVIKEYNKEAKLIYSSADIKAAAHGNQSKFEELFLIALVDILQNTNTFGSGITIELKQRNHDAIVTILNDNHEFSEEAIDQINKIKKEDNFKGDIQIIPGEERKIEVIIKIPLQFQAVKISRRFNLFL